MAVSFYEWRNPRISFDVRLERLADLPVNFIANRRMLTVSAKRRLYDHGRFGVATVLRAPRRIGGAAVGGEGVGRFKVRIESAWWRTYDVWVTQSFSLIEWGLLQTGAMVECRVDPHKPWRVLLCAPEPLAA